MVERYRTSPCMWSCVRFRSSGREVLNLRAVLGGSYAADPAENGKKSAFLATVSAKKKRRGHNVRRNFPVFDFFV